MDPHPDASVRWAFRVVLAALTALLVPISTARALLPLGPSFQINSYTTASQGSPDVSGWNDGFVVVWTSEQQDGSSIGQFGQRFDSAAGAVGSEFQVNTYTTSLQGEDRDRSSVSAAPDGSFVAVWASSRQDGSPSPTAGVFARRYDASGNPQGTEFQVNEYTTGHQGACDVAVGADSRFVVAWVSDAQDGDETGIFARRYDSAGAPEGTEFPVNTYTTGPQDAPHVSAGSDGRFVVVWRSRHQVGPYGGSLRSIHARRYDAAGTPLGAEFEVPTSTSSGAGYPEVSMAGDDSFVVAWGGTAVRRFDSNGAPLMPELQLEGGGRPAVASEADGSFALAWSRSGTAFVQRFDSTGNPLSNAASLARSGQAPDPAVAFVAPGELVVTWSSYDSHSRGVFARHFEIGTTTTTTTMPLPPPCGPVPLPDHACLLAQPPAAGKSVLRIVSTSDPDRDRVDWRWKKGRTSGIQPFLEQPLGTSSYRLCIYDSSTAAQPIFTAEIPDDCDGEFCWRSSRFALGDVSKSVRGRSRFRKADGAPDGVTKGLYRYSHRRADLRLLASGPSLSPPSAADIVPEVVVELSIDDGDWVTCYKTSFPGASGKGGVRKHTSTEIILKGP